MFKMEGLDKLSRDLADAQKAMEALDGELGKVSFEADDPASIEAAVQQIMQTLDERVGHYASNPIVSEIVDGLKLQYRQAILDKAAAARLGEAQNS